MLKIENLTSGYQGKPVIKNIGLEAFPLETLVLMGPSGGGKSTLLLTVLGIVAPFEGKIFLDDHEITQIPIEKRNIGYLPQDYGLFPHLSVQDNVTFGLKVRGLPTKIREKKAQLMLELVHLQGFEKRKIHELSGGERQRVGLARALAIDPSLLLLDEPLSNIDQVTKYEVAAQLKELFQKLKIPVILVTHNPEDALFFADKLAILMQGQIEQYGALKELLERPKNAFIQRLLRPFS